MHKPQLKEIADLRGLSGQILFAMDTQSNPGKVVCHFVRLETIEFEQTPGFDHTQFTVLHPDADKRLEHLAGCFLPGYIAEVRKAKVLLESMLADTKVLLPIPARVRLGLILVQLNALSQV